MQELELDMYTFSPELKLQLGRVSSNDPGLTLDKVMAPMGAGVEEDGEGEYSMGEAKQVGEIVTIDEMDLKGNEGKWKIVPVGWYEEL